MRQLFLALVMILSLSTLCFAQDEAQPVPEPSLLNTGLKLSVDTLYNLNHSKLTAGIGIDAVSIYDILYLGVSFIGATEGDLLKDGIVGPRSTVDINKGVTYLASKLTKANVKWLLGDYMPRIGYTCTYNLLNNPNYNKFEHWIILNIFNF